MGEVAKSTELEGVALQVRKIGNSVGVILPKELLARLRLKEGDVLHVVEQTERGQEDRRVIDCKQSVGWMGEKSAAGRAGEKDAQVSVTRLKGRSYALGEIDVTASSEGAL